jgi:hypothetical protein
LAQNLKYPAESHPTAQYEQGFQYLHAEGLKLFIHDYTVQKTSEQHSRKYWAPHWKF